MEMLQLKYFYESANFESFAKAAKKFDVPPTSVSASVKRLENQLNCSLFEREANKIRLNNNGKRLMLSLNKIFDELDKAIGDITSISDDNREVKILVKAMRGEITSHIIEYKTKHPQIRFKTVFDFDEKNFDDYDIIIDQKSAEYYGFESIDLYHTKIVLRVSDNSDLLNRKLCLKQLSDMPFISIGENSSLNKIFVDACKNVGFEPNIVVMSNDILCNTKCVEAGVGIGVGRYYEGSGKESNVKILNITDFNVLQTICCFFKKQSAYGNVKHFIDFIKNKTTNFSKNLLD